MKQKFYSLVQENNKQQLVDTVQNNIDDGWIAIGGVSVCALPKGGVIYTQAMVMPKKS